MATVNQIGSALLGTVGSGLFVGDTDPIITLQKVNNANIGVAGSTFTLNGTCGVLTTGLLSGIADNAFVTYTWFNSFFVSGSFILVNPQRIGTSTRLFGYICALPSGTGKCTLRATNTSGGTISGTCSFNYLVL